MQPNSLKIFKIEENNHPYAAKGEAKQKWNAKATSVDVWMTAIRSHFTPDNIEGIKVGDEVYFHVTNLEQDWDVPHGFAIKDANNAEILIMPGETQTLKFKADKAGIYPILLHRLLLGTAPGNARVPTGIAPGSNVALLFSTGKNLPAVTAATDSVGKETTAKP